MFETVVHEPFWPNLISLQYTYISIFCMASRDHTGEGAHLPGTPASGKLDSNWDARSLRATKNGAEDRTKGKAGNGAHQAHARMAVGLGRRG